MNTLTPMNDAQVKDYLTYLYRVADIVSRKRFADWYQANESIYANLGSKIHDKLRYDFQYQVRQQLDHEAIEKPKHEMFSQIAEQIVAAADVISMASKIDVKKKDRIIPIGRTVQDIGHAVHEFFSSNALCHRRLCVPAQVPNHFYVRNTISALDMYVQSRFTLVSKTGNKNFDKWLETMPETYLSEGYPHDVLVCDAGIVRSPDRKPIAIIAEKKYASSRVVEDFDKWMEFRDKKPTDKIFVTL